MFVRKYFLCANLHIYSYIAVKVKSSLLLLFIFAFNSAVTCDLTVDMPQSLYQFAYKQGNKLVIYGIWGVFKQTLVPVSKVEDLN